VRVEAELVDAVVAGESVSKEVGDGTDLLDELVARLFDIGPGTCTTTVLIDLTYDSGDLVGGCPGVGLGK
jgi:hypothetical protein